MRAREIGKVSEITSITFAKGGGSSFTFFLHGCEGEHQLSSVGVKAKKEVVAMVAVKRPFCGLQPT